MNHSENDIPLSEAVARIVRGKRVVTICFAVGIAIGSLYAFTARHIFVSEITILPQSQNSPNGGGAAGLVKRLSGLASVAGLPIGGLDSDARDAAIASLSSYQSLSTFLETEGIQQTVLDGSSSGDVFASWTDRKPTMWKAVRAFKKHLEITQAKDSSLIRVAIEWYDPVSASNWTNDLVALVDAKLRARALETARARMTYLQKEFESNPVVAVREVVSGMMESELRTIATAGADREFAFRVIDPAIRAELPARPRRSLIIVGFAFCGLLVGAIFAVLSSRYRRPLNSTVQ